MGAGLVAVVEAGWHERLVGEGWVKCEGNLNEMKFSILSASMQNFRISVGPTGTNRDRP